MSDILIRNMKMPKDCPMCPMAHYDALNHFRGCEVTPGKRHAINDPNYANTSIRPDWCPLVEVPPHGRLIDADALTTYPKPIGKLMMYGGEYVYTQTAIDDAPTIIEAEDGA